jgi:hypothetical protein
MPNRETQILPYKITDYVREHFREDFLFEVKKVVQVNGHPQYEIEVSKDDYIHRLSFNENGDLIREDAEQAFPADEHEGPNFEEVPD